ncbi:MAG TPA: BTAD domain-containing putative transcriptional regulator [Anaerolineaceae bacterium]|nr:BTAD domain-containing putative transcriptional regulator [Anaerolineaceae bacterium]
MFIDPSQAVAEDSRLNPLTIYLLGRPHAMLPDGEVVEFQVDNTLLLMTCLATHPGKVFRRTELATLFYPDHDDLRANQNIRQVIHRLRKLLKDDEREAPGLLVSSANICINPDGPLVTDLRQFMECEQSTRRFIQQHSHRRLSVCRTCADQLKELVERYTGDLLDGYTPCTDGPLDDMILRFRKEIQDKYTWALRLLANTSFERQDYDRSLACLKRLLDLEPLDEFAMRMTMKILASNGHRNLALLRFHEFQRTLQTTLDLMPEEETLWLAQDIRSGKKAFNPASLPASPLPVTYQEVNGELLPDITLPFYGREKEIAQILDLLESQEHRVIAIKGVIGSGKTRFALHVAAMEQKTWADGVYMVLLKRDMPHATSLVSTLVQALGVPSKNTSEHRKNLIAFLHQKECLIVIDNLDEIPDQAEVIQSLVALCPKVKFMITTRKHLGIRGEQTVYFNGLDFPPAQTFPGGGTPEELEAFIQQYAALRLFREAARRAKPDFTIDPANLADIIQVCQMLIGLPLGIELAASSTRLFTCAEIRDGIYGSLNGVESLRSFIASRHGSLKKRFAYVWDSLTAEERNLAKAVYRYPSGIPTRDLLDSQLTTMDTLVTLQDKSTLIKLPGGSKVKLHPLVRFYISQ